MNFKGNCMTTAMGIMPHKDIGKALKQAMAFDIPFWPQLPRVSFYEDMYVQVTENFPGIVLDEPNLKVSLSTEGFYRELEEYIEKSVDQSIYGFSEKYSVVYDEFLKQDLSGYYAIRGQSIGPVSFGLKIADEDRKPIIYNDEIRGFLYDFVAQKVNYQYRELKEKNQNSFVWVDEPGLEFLFGSFTGYTGERAKIDYHRFLQELEGPKGVHLCGNPDWSFLLSGLDLQILSVDVFGNGRFFTRYAEEIKNFLKKGNIISWGIVPTLTEEFDKEGVDTLLQKLEEYWDYLDQHGIPKKNLLEQAWLAPARCCLVNVDGDKTVEKSFEVLQEVSHRLKDKYNLD